PVTIFELHWFVALIVMSFLAFLHLLQVLLEMCSDFGELLCPLLHYRGIPFWRFCVHIDAQVRLVAHQCHCRGHSCRRVFRLVICELRHWQPVRPIILQIVHITAQVVFQCLVLALCLAVGLWMIRCG